MVKNVFYHEEDGDIINLGDLDDQFSLCVLVFKFYRLQNLLEAEFGDYRRSPEEPALKTKILRMCTNLSKKMR